MTLRDVKDKTIKRVETLQRGWPKGILLKGSFSNKYKVRTVKWGEMIKWVSTKQGWPSKECSSVIGMVEIRDIDKFQSWSWIVITLPNFITKLEHQINPTIKQGLELQKTSFFFLRGFFSIVTIYIYIPFCLFTRIGRSRSEPP